MKRRDLFSYFLVSEIAGCATVSTQSGVGSSSGSGPSSDRKPAKLRFAVSDVKGLEDLKKDYEPLRGLLAHILNVPVEFFPVESYIAAASALQLDQVDLVFTGPSEYVVMSARTGIVPMIAVQRERYYAVVVVNAGSGIKSLKDLQGKTIAMWEVGSTSGYLGPIKLLTDAGLDPKSDVQIELLGKRGLTALRDRKVDAWAGSIRRYDKFLESEELPQQRFPLIATGPTLPADPFVASSKLDRAFVAKMQQQLFQHGDKILAAIATADGAKFTGAKIIEAADTDFNPIRDAYKAVGQGAFFQS
ncbi:MAG: phosphate/phosphite/phosphonate ABC transporter substrate-binding protein [Leptolyngbyaceae cyanobacterium bins.349]|nr:phosphate/phosphite/phosphonate ABC transporter substrate-binding protein [Leptolyngbyaceae cyanobacterium bins.349]